MKKLTAIILLSAFATPSFAQQPPFVPYTIPEQAHRELMTFLGDVPAKYSNPIANVLTQLAQQAAHKKMADDSAAAKKATDAAKEKK